MVEIKTRKLRMTKNVFGLRFCERAPYLMLHNSVPEANLGGRYWFKDPQCFCHAARPPKRTHLRLGGYGGRREGWEHVSASTQ